MSSEPFQDHAQADVGVGVVWRVRNHLAQLVGYPLVFPLFQMCRCRLADEPQFPVAILLCPVHSLHPLELFDFLLSLDPAAEPKERRAKRISGAGMCRVEADGPLGRRGRFGGLPLPQTQLGDAGVCLDVVRINQQRHLQLCQGLVVPAALQQDLAEPSMGPVLLGGPTSTRA